MLFSDKQRQGERERERHPSMTIITNFSPSNTRYLYKQLSFLQSIRIANAALGMEAKHQHIKKYEFRMDAKMTYIPLNSRNRKNSRKKYIFKKM